MSDSILTAHNLSMTFPNGNGGLRALQHVQFEVCRKEFVCVVGPSGCGKTTLLRLLAGLLLPTGGEVIFEGHKLSRPRRRIGFVFQDASLMPWRTVLSNIFLPLELQGLPQEECEQRAKSMIELVGLNGFEESLPRISPAVWHSAWRSHGQ
jgi:NitT/TauT family transport system ATP-binding protein